MTEEPARFAVRTLPDYRQTHYAIANRTIEELPQITETDSIIDAEAVVVIGPGKTHIMTDNGVQIREENVSVEIVIEEVRDRILSEIREERADS